MLQPKPQQSVGRQPLKWLVIGGVVYYIAAVVALHFLQPERDPVGWPMSAYVLTENGWLMTSTYFVLAGALLSLTILLVGSLPSSRLSVIASVFMLVGAVGGILAGVYPMDDAGSEATQSGFLHMVAGMLSFPSFALGPLLFSLAICRSASSEAPCRFALPLAIAVTICNPLYFLAIDLGFRTEVYVAGLAQRVLFLFLFAWMVVVANCAGSTRANLEDA